MGASLDDAATRWARDLKYLKHLSYVSGRWLIVINCLDQVLLLCSFVLLLSGRDSIAMKLEREMQDTGVDECAH